MIGQGFFNTLKPVSNSCAQFDVSLSTGYSSNYYFHTPSGAVKSKAYGVSPYLSYGVTLSDPYINGASIKYFGAEANPGVTDSFAWFIIVLEGTLSSSHFEYINMLPEYLGFNERLETADADMFEYDAYGNTVWGWQVTYSSGYPWFNHSNPVLIPCGVDCMLAPYIMVGSIYYGEGDTINSYIFYESTEHYCIDNNIVPYVVNPSGNTITNITSGSTPYFATALFDLDTFPTNATLISFTLNASAVTCPILVESSVPLQVTFGELPPLTINVRVPPNV